MDEPSETRLLNSAHTSRPWRIHEIAPDFRLEDVWELSGLNGPDDFPRAVELLASFDASQSSSAAVRWLFAIRWKLGELLGWDDPRGGLGSRVPTLRDRLPVELREGPGPEFAALPSTPLYLTEDEFAAEVANQTMHVFGNAYMAATRPFRHLIVYPALMREAREMWERANEPTAART